MAEQKVDQHTAEILSSTRIYDNISTNPPQDSITSPRCSTKSPQSPIFFHACTHIHIYTFV